MMGPYLLTAESLSDELLLSARLRDGFPEPATASEPAAGVQEAKSAAADDGMEDADERDEEDDGVAEADKPDGVAEADEPDGVAEADEPDGVAEADEPDEVPSKRLMMS